MNHRIIIYYIGTLLKIEAFCMMLPLLCSIIYKEKVFIYFLIVIGLLLFLGFLLSYKSPNDMRFFTAEGFLIVAIGWIMLSIFGALPFYLSGEIPHYIDALFETVSGFTTTGATILTNVESISKGLLFWRSFTHFIGGMGALVLMLAILPTNSDDMLIMKAESPGPQVGKLKPKVRDTAKYLYLIYVFITTIVIISLFISGMPIFDSFCIGFGAAGTGGFVVTNEGINSYGTVSKLLIASFIVLYGVNFNIYYSILNKKIKDAFASEELRVYLLIIICATIAIGLSVYNIFNDTFKTFLESFFQVASIMTTTGYSTYDYTEWAMFSQVILLTLMIIGGCAGSTGGGFKVSRIIILIKVAINELYIQLHPHSVKSVKYENKPISMGLIRTLASYAIIYIGFIIFGTILISLDNFDFTTTFSSVIETFNNIGLGLSKIGPKGNFSIFSDFSKLVFIILMITGRLEIFPIIILFSKKTWRREA